MKVRCLGLLFLIAFMTNSCMFAQNQKAKYVFLFIGDGMGFNQFYSTELYNASLKGIIGRVPLTFSTFPVQSYISTYSANNYITCSSAAGTALASGNKTNNYVLGKNPELNLNFETIAEKAKKQGYKVGILSSVPINHATPAAFYAHQNKRNMYYEIALDMAKSNFDYFGGGGLIDPKGKNDSLPDAFNLAKENGYTIVESRKDFQNLKPGLGKVYAINPQKYNDGEFNWVIDKKTGVLTLAQFTQKGIDLIDNPKGFFMMVEGGKIDWACHSNDAGSVIYEVMAFDSAVNAALDFYKKHPNETLILVTADHETGGMVTGNNNGTGLNLALLQNQKISSAEFGFKLDKLKQLDAAPDFEAILDIIKADFGLGNQSIGMELSDSEKSIIKDAYIREFTNNIVDQKDKSYLDKNGETLAEIVVSILNKKAGIGWTTHDHSASPVPLRAIGVGQERFTGFIDNTQIPMLIMELMQIK